ncbi:MAG: 50S ribosomal protein L15 [Myxococcota bacterium]
MLSRLKPNKGSRRPRKRIGRGVGSGSAKTAGRGQKGAGSRAGRKHKPHREGGQIPLVMRIPKRGFTNIFDVPVQVVNVKALKLFKAGAEVDAAALAGAGLVRDAAAPVKLLGTGDLSVALKVRVSAISDSARKKVEAAGGSVEIQST